MGSQREKKDHRDRASPQKSEMSVWYERIHLGLALWDFPCRSTGIESTKPGFFSMGCSLRPCAFFFGCFFES